MNKQKLNEVVERCVEDTRNAIQIVYDALNSGQKKKVAKEDSVKELFDRYGVVYE